MSTYGTNRPYLTFGRYVHLGKVPDQVRRRAVWAGLKPIPARQMGQMIRHAHAMARTVKEGSWFDTVKY
jgi:hypothetical protein